LLRTRFFSSNPERSSLLRATSRTEPFGSAFGLTLRLHLSSFVWPYLFSFFLRWASRRLGPIRRDRLPPLCPLRDPMPLRTFYPLHGCLLLLARTSASNERRLSQFCPHRFVFNRPLFLFGFCNFPYQTPPFPSPARPRMESMMVCTHPIAFPSQTYGQRLPKA